MNMALSFVGRFNFGRTSLTGFPAQSVRSSNAYALDSPYFLVLNTETSQSRQHDMSESVDTHDLRQPLPLVSNSQGRHVIPFHHFINNDLEYLRGGVSSRKYSTSVTKTTTADYGHIKWIEDLVPNSMWSQMIVKYDKFALWGISHWGKKIRQFYAFATSRESARDVYSKRQIIAASF
ncbi:hypothetical protein Tco_0685603 [Tanacetum coccineum]